MTRTPPHQPVTQLTAWVNIDHVATIRNARGGNHPDPVKAALLAEEAGADGITAHLREDRRHIREHDLSALMSAISLPLNLEMAATDEMCDIALATQPNAACIVPEKREEVTTEGGLDVLGLRRRLEPILVKLKDAGIGFPYLLKLTLIRSGIGLGADIIGAYRAIL